MSNGGPAAPAGWYENPYPGGEGMRYWDGERWTDPPPPAAPASSAPVPQPSSVLKGLMAQTWFRLVVGLVVGVAAFFVMQNVSEMLGLAGSPGKESVSASEIESAISADLEERGIDVKSLECVDPGDAVSAGDRTSCRGNSREGLFNILVTFNSDGSYLWESR